MITPKSCFEIRCDGGCDDEWEDGVAHFESEAEALDTVRSYEWLVVDGRHLCPQCAAKADCAATGHQWAQWRESVHTIAGRTYRTRYCDHCSARDYDPPFEHLVVLRQAAEAAGAALTDGGAA